MHSNTYVPHPTILAFVYTAKVRIEAARDGGRKNPDNHSHPLVPSSGVPRNFVREGGVRDSKNLVEDRGQRERGSGGGSPIVRGSEGSCNLVQEISFHIVKFS